MEFRAGQVLGRTFSVFGKNIISLGILGLIFNGPFMLPQVQEWGIRHSMLFLLAYLASVLLMQATVVYIVFQQLRGDHASIGKAFGVGLSRLFPVIGTVLLLGLALIGSALPGFVLGFATRSAILSLIAVYIPVLLVMMMFYVVVPVSVVERPGVMLSLKRSQELTEGHRWGVFGIFLVTFVLGVVINLLLARALWSDSLDMTTYRIVDGIVDVVFSLIYVVGVAVTYHDLRLEKDGVSVDELASVFE